MQVTVGGQPVSILAGSLQIDDAIGERSTCAFVVRDLAGALSFQKGQPVEVRDDAGQLVFAGVVDSASFRVVGAGPVRLHQIQCTDWHYLADKRIAARAWEGVSAGAIVRALVDDILSQEGVTYTPESVQDGPVVQQAVINYRPVTEALDALAEKAGFIWYIDVNRVLHFVERATYAAPWTLTGGDTRVRDCVVEHGNPKYRNRQYVKGGRALTDPQVETKPGDGESRSFAVGFPIGKVPTVEVDRGTGWVQETVGIKGVETGKQWYWSKGDPVLVQDSAEPVIQPGQRLRITYQGEFDIVVLTHDPAAVEDRRQIEGGGTGWVEDVADEPNVSTREAAFEVANAKLRRYAAVGRRLRFRTRRTGLRPGQILTVVLPDHGLSGVEMLVESVTVSDGAGAVLWHDVVAVEGPELGSWTRVFQALATRGQAFVERVNIGEDQILIVLESFAEEWAWAETVTPNVFACPVPSVDLYPSSTLYPC